MNAPISAEGDAGPLDELLQLAGERALLADKIRVIDERMTKLREELTGPPPRQRKALPPAAGESGGGGTVKDRVLELMRSEPPVDRNAVVVGDLLGITRAQAASALRSLEQRGDLKWVSRGVYRARKRRTSSS